MLRLTRRGTASVTDGVLVVGWTRRVVDGNGTWLRWQSPQVTTRGELEEAWQKADIWSLNPGDDEKRREVAVTPLAGLADLLLPRECLDQPAVQRQRRRGAPRPAARRRRPPRQSARSLPDGVRLVLNLPPGQAISGTLTRDWVRPTVGGTAAMKQQHSRGAALLTAMLTVALVATFAAAALWQQWRSIEVETAERARVQSAWILTGALDWARLILREDGRPQRRPPGRTLGRAAAGSPPFELSRGRPQQQRRRTGPEVLEAFLSGQIIDLQSLLNVNNLVEANGKLSQSGVREFSHACSRCSGCPGRNSNAWRRTCALPRTSAPATAPAPWRRCVPQRVEQLAWLGLSAQTRGGAAALCHRVARAHRSQPEHRQCRSDLRERPPAQHGRRPACWSPHASAPPFKTTSDACKLLPGGAPAAAQGPPEVGVASQILRGSRPAQAE